MKTVFIYCLKDPGTGDVRYIGKTENLKKRLREHVKDSSKMKNHLGKWLRSLKGQTPLLVVLHEVTKNESWQEEEMRYISCARALGVDLVNATDGGEGASGYFHTLESRTAMSAAARGVPKSPEHRAALSAAAKGVPNSPGHRAAISVAMTGVPKSPACCAAISAALKGRPLSPGHCAALRVPKKPHSPERRAAQSARRKGVPTGPLSTEHRAALREAMVGRPWSVARRAAYERNKS